MLSGLGRNDTLPVTWLSYCIVDLSHLHPEYSRNLLDTSKGFHEGRWRCVVSQTERICDHTAPSAPETKWTALEPTSVQSHNTSQTNQVWGSNVPGHSLVWIVWTCPNMHPWGTKLYFLPQWQLVYLFCECDVVDMFIVIYKKRKLQQTYPQNS